jgi:hypothetical protein
MKSSAVQVSRRLQGVTDTVADQCRRRYVLYYFRPCKTQVMIGEADDSNDES